MNMSNNSAALPMSEILIDGAKLEAREIDPHEFEKIMAQKEKEFAELAYQMRPLDIEKLSRTYITI